MRQDRQGIALVTALAIVVVVSLLVAGTVFSTQIELWTTRNDTSSTKAYYVAHAGLQKYKTAAFQTYRFYLGNLDQYGSELTKYATCGNLLSVGLDLNRDFTLDATDLTPTSAGITESMGDGQYTVSYSVDGADVLIRSVGEVNGAKSTVQTVFRPKNAGLFANALFAGQGQGGKFINGGAAIWGSVYVEGDDPTQTVIATNGDFGMHNFYTEDQLRTLLGNKFTSTQLKTLLKDTATDQKDLCARLRVASGRVSTGGSTLIGDTSAPTGYNGNIAGINVSDGSTGTGGAISITGATDIRADNYPSGDLSYDLSKPLELPDLTTTGCKSDPTSTWSECMDNSASATFTFGAGATGGPTCDLTPVLSGSELAFGTTSISCVDTTSPPTAGFTYTFDSATNTGKLKVYGLIQFVGYDLHFNKNVLVEFSDKATIVARASGSGGGDVIVDGDIVPAQSFPDQDVLGIIAQNDLTFTGANQTQLLSSQQVAVGLFYAGGQAAIEKGGMVMGTVMASTLKTSSGNAGQTAKVLQVPGLEYNLAPGFTDIPNDMLATFRVLSYERR